MMRLLACALLLPGIVAFQPPRNSAFRGLSAAPTPAIRGVRATVAKAMGGAAPQTVRILATFDSCFIFLASLLEI